MTLVEDGRECEGLIDLPCRVETTVALSRTRVMLAMDTATKPCVRSIRPLRIVFENVGLAISMFKEIPDPRTGKNAFRYSRVGGFGVMLSLHTWNTIGMPTS